MSVTLLLYDNNDTNDGDSSHLFIRDQCRVHSSLQGQKMLPDDNCIILFIFVFISFVYAAHIDIIVCVMLSCLL